MKRLWAIAAALTLVAKVEASSVSVLGATDAHLADAAVQTTAVLERTAIDVYQVASAPAFPSLLLDAPHAITVGAIQPAGTVLRTLSVQGVTGTTPWQLSSGPGFDPLDSLDRGVTLTMPLPAAGWLFGSALVGFVMLANRRKV